uniref:Zinc-finger domain-containing protein n=1 Tax=Aegilops tauschii subsp. strangulata TaxID=200361 RepID=A0A453NGM7_AEGTS
MEIDLNRDARDGDAERVAAPQSNRAVRVEVVAQEGNGDGGMVAAAEGVGAAPETVGVGAEEGVAPEKNGVGSGGEKGVASEGSGAGAEVGAAVETNGVAGDVWICHQCRQRKTGLTAACRGSKKNGKCTLRYCKNCIRNRYPLIADEVLKEEAWECPKCRNDCNCSKCKKRRGEEPAGPMVHSVKRPKGKCKKRRGEEPAGPTVHSVKRPKGNLRRIESTDALKDEIVIPKGTLVTCVAGVEMQPEDVGAAIQFLEFCRSFGEVVTESK